MTVEAWVRPSRAGGWRTVVVKERPGGVVYGLYGDQGGARPLGQVDIGGERNAVGSAALPLNAWSHLATTYDGAVVRLFVNGVQAGSLPFSGSMAASTGALRMGGNGDLVGVVRGVDRRGACLQPRAQRERDPTGHADTGREARAVHLAVRAVRRA